MRWRQLLMTAILSTAAAWPASMLGACLHDGDVRLTGRLVQQTYPGPPDFQSVTRGDEPRVIWILQLDSSTCIVSSDPSYANRYNEREIQIVLGGQQYAHSNHYTRYRHLLGRRIAVTGQLLPGGGKYEKHFVIAARSITASAN